jgi:hypothetical protein
MNRIHKLRLILYRSTLSHFGHLLAVINIDISAPLAERQFFRLGFPCRGDRLNPFVPAIFATEQVDGMISKVHHAFFVSFKYFHTARTGESHRTKAFVKGSPGL